MKFSVGDLARVRYAAGMAGSNALQLKISLVGSKPEIWRRLVVSKDLSLGGLHVAIQFAMGWEGAHLHEFRSGRMCYGTPEEGSTLSEHETTLGKVLSRKGSKITYEYDFGDSWEHLIVVEKAVKDCELPADLIAGARACPPEDIGGIHTYSDIVRKLARAKAGKAKLAEGLAEWLPEGFDPAAFDLEKNRESLRQAFSETEEGEDDEDDGGSEYPARDAQGEPLVYDPNDSRGPEDVRWFGVDESVRCEAIMAYHSFTGQPAGENPMAHAAIHVVVEAQLLERHPPEAVSAMKRLMRAGLTRHEALHRVGGEFAKQLFHVANGDMEDFDQDQYVRDLLVLGA